MKTKAVRKVPFRLPRTGMVTLLATFLLVAVSGSYSWMPDTGVVYEIETTNHTGARSTDTTAISVLSPNLLKISTVEGKRGAARTDVVFRGDRREVIFVEHRERSYMVFDQKMIDEVGEQLKEVKKMTENMNIPKAALDRMPEEQRKKLEAMMGQGKPAGPPELPDLEYRNTGETATKQGYPCVKYEVLRDGTMVQELWLTNWDNVEGGQDVQVVFSEMASFFKEMMASIENMLGGEGGGFFGGVTNPVDSFTELDGIPVVSREFDNGELESESFLRSASRRTLDPADFEPPAGYKRRSMMGGG